MNSSRAVGCGSPEPRESPGRYSQSAFPHIFDVRRDVENIVPLVLCGGHRVVEAGRRVSKGCVNEPPLPFAGPDGPAKPTRAVLGLPVPLEMPNIPRFEVDRVPVTGTQHCDARVRTMFALSGLSDEAGGR